MDMPGDEHDWIEWSGGKCPLSEGTPFAYRLRGGGTGPVLRTPTAWRWEHDGGPFDIVAYRVAPASEAA